MLFPRWADFSPKTPARVSRSFCGNLLEARCAAKQPRTTLRNSVLVRFDTTLARISVLAQIPKSKGGAGLRARPVQGHNDASPHPRYVHPDPKCNGLDPIRIHKPKGGAGLRARPAQVHNDMSSCVHIPRVEQQHSGRFSAWVLKPKGAAGLRARPDRVHNDATPH